MPKSVVALTVRGNCYADDRQTQNESESGSCGRSTCQFSVLRKRRTGCGRHHSRFRTRLRARRGSRFVSFRFHQQAGYIIVLRGRADEEI